MDQLIKKANKIYLENFEAVTNFERAVFFSWYCDIGDCKFCYMSTQTKKIKGKIARRTPASLIAEAIIIKKLKWDFGFLSGGQKAYNRVEFLDLLQKINTAYGKKIWINVGALDKADLVRFKPYIKGVVASIETINPKVHSFVCPSKPIEPFTKMLEESTKLKLKNAMTIILGLGETKADFAMLENFISKYKISKIHFYGLNPHKKTIFEKKKSPTKEYHAWWIAKTRISFPKIDIQFGIWADRVERVKYLLCAGANSISKFPAIKLFGKSESKKIEKLSKDAKRKFVSSITVLPKINWNKEVDKLKLDSKLKEDVKIKLNNYLKKMNK